MTDTKQKRKEYPEKYKSVPSYVSNIRTAKRAANWCISYMLHQFTSHRLYPLTVSAKTEQLIAKRNRVTKRLIASIREDLEEYKKQQEKLGK